MKLALGITHDDRGIDSYHYGSMLDYLTSQLSKEREGEDTVLEEVLRAQSSSVALARNTLTETFLKESTADYLLTVDADMVFPIDQPDRMLGLAVERDLPVLAGIAAICGQGEVLATNVYRYDDKSGYYAPVNTPLAPHTLLRISACGGACVLVRRDVFEATGPGWFNHKIRPDDDVFGEDLSFYGERLREADIPVHCHTDAIFGHSKATVQYPMTEESSHG